jgi:hypothetical protein
MAPGAAAVTDHPLTLNLREDQAVEVINRWIGGLFAPENLDATVATLVGVQATPVLDGEALAQIKARRADAEARLRRYQEAIGAGGGADRAGGGDRPSRRLSGAQRSRRAYRRAESATEAAPRTPRIAIAAMTSQARFAAPSHDRSTVRTSRVIHPKARMPRIIEGGTAAPRPRGRARAAYAATWSCPHRWPQPSP